MIKTEKEQVQMTIFSTNATEDYLKKVILEQDRTFYPLGTGGYSVREDPRKKNSFILTEQDTAPASSYVIGVKGKDIWCRQLADFVSAILLEEEIAFTVNYKNFESFKKVTEAFLK